MSPLSSATKEVDIDFLVFVERYATDLLKWDILTFFGHNPDFCAPTSQIAQHIGRSSLSIRPELGDLALLGILDQTQSKTGKTLYRLTKDPHLRSMTLKFANNQLVTHMSEAAS
jgi:hypothetical protein